MEDANMEKLKEMHYKKRYQELNKIVRNLSESEGIEYLKCLDSNNVYHVFLRLQIIKRFKVHREIFQILKGENMYLITNVLKFNFLFREDSAMKSWEYFSNKMIPYISYSTRIKLLTNLRKFNESSEQVENFFTEILNKYSLRQALILLPSCSPEFIKRTIQFYHLKLSKKELQLIGKTHGVLVYWYLEELIKDKGKKYNITVAYYFKTVKFMKRIIKAEEFVDFLIQHISSIDQSVGLRLSKFIMKNHREIVLTSAQTFHGVLRKEIIASYLSPEEFITFYGNLFSSDKKQFSYQICNPYGTVDLLAFINKFPKFKQQELLVQGFQNAYNENLNDCTCIVQNKNILPLKLMTGFPEKQRECWAEAKLIDEPVNHKFISLLSTSMSIPKIKVLLKQASDVLSRTPLVESLITTCFINKDAKALAKILIYVVDRYRNDDFSIRMAINDVYNNLFQEMDLGVEHWRPIEDNIRLFAVKKEYYAIRKNNLVIKCIEIRLENQQPVDELVQIIIKMMDEGEDGSWTTSKSCFERELLLSILENTLIIFPEKTTKWDSKRSIVRNILERVSLFNEQNQENIIPSEKYAFFYKQLEIMCENTASKPYEDLTLLYTLSNKQHELQQLKIELLIENTTPDLIRFFMKKDILKIQENMPYIIANILDARSLAEYSFFFPKLKTLSFVGTRDIVIERCAEAMYDPELSSKGFAIVLLCKYARGDMANNLFSNYYPTEKKITGSDDDVMHELRTNIAKSIFQLDPLVAFGVLQRFTESDYLISSLGSLYSICIRKPLNSSMDFLRKTLNSKVSIKKHVIRLIWQMASFQEVQNSLLNLTVENNVSIRYEIYNILFNSVVVDRRPENVKLLIDNIGVLTENDSKVWDDFIRQLNRVPDDYFPLYCESIWVRLNNVIFVDTNALIQYKTQFLSNFTEHNTKLLPLTFFQNILNTYLFDLTAPQRLHNTFILFAIVYLKRISYEVHIQDADIQQIVTIYNNKIIIPLTNSDDDTNNRLREFSKLFTTQLFARFNGDVNQEEKLRIVQVLLQNLKQPLLSVYALVDTLHLDITVISMESWQNIRELSSKAAAICNEAAEKYGVESILLFYVDVIDKLIGKNAVVNRNEAKIMFAENCLKISDSLPCQILITKILRTELNFISEKYAKKLKRINQQLKSSQYISIRTYANN